MKITLLKNHFERKKISSIMNYDTFVYLLEWYADSYRPHQEFKLPFDNWIYAKTSDREFLSKWMEKFIVKFISIENPDWMAKKVDNRGKAIVTRSSLTRPNGIVDVNYKREGYKKDPNQIIGEPDIKVKRPFMRDLYFEVKIGNDRLSDDQKKFIESGFGEVYVIKTVEQFLEVWQEITANERKQ